MKKVMTLMLMIIVLVANAGCSKKSDAEKADDGSVVIKVPHYKAGENVGAKFFLPQVERFNSKYAGQYKIIIEEVPQDNYMAKIKLLQQQGKLPPLVERGDRDFLENVIIKNELFFDLKPWLDSKPELKKMMIEDSIAYNTIGGKIFSTPKIVVRPIGLYYNKKMFASAGIEKPVSRMSFEEFEAAMEKLKNAGYDPIAFMTSENAWTTSLLFTSIIASEPGGAKMLKEQEVQTDYTSKIWVDSFAKLQRFMQKYSTQNAIGAAYADAANAFLNNKAAVIPNGPWMVGDFSDTSKASEGFDKIVGAEIYPGGSAIAIVKEYDWWIPKGLDPEVRGGALAFLEFINTPEEIEAYMIAEGGNAPKLKVSDDFNSKLNPILVDLNNSVSNDLQNLVPRMTELWPMQLGEQEFGRMLPKLVDGSLTPEEFAAQLSKKAQQFN